MKQVETEPSLPEASNPQTHAVSGSGSSANKVPFASSASLSCASKSRASPD